MGATIRTAVRADLRRINEIYNSYIVGRHTSFDTEPWTDAERAAWFGKYDSGNPRYQVVVVEWDGEVAGFASSSPFRDKAAYDTSVETTVVLDERAIGRGLGRALLEELVDRLCAADVHRAYALIALPNEPSVRLHADLGYRTVGTLEEVGRKLGAYHSVHIMELPL